MHLILALKAQEEAGPAAAGPESSPTLTVMLSSQASRALRSDLHFPLS